LSVCKITGTLNAGKATIITRNKVCFKTYANKNLLSNIFIYLRVIRLILCNLFKAILFSLHNASILKDEKKSYQKTDCFFDLLIDFLLIAV